MKGTLCLIGRYIPRNLLNDCWAGSQFGKFSFCTAPGPVNSPVTSPSTETEIKRESLKNVFNSKSPGDEVRIQGWVRAFRKQKYITFLEINDGSTHHRLPVVCPAKFAPLELGMHASVDITGVLNPSPKNSSVIELHPNAPVDVVGPCDQQTYPFGGKIRYEDEYIRQFLHLRSKTNRFAALFRLRSKATRSVHDYFHRNDYVQIHTPILTSNDCEGAGEVFLVRPANENLMMEKPKAPSERRVSSVKIQAVQTHDHSDLPFDGQKHTHTHTCDACGKVFEHTHTKKPAHVSKTYDNHYCDDHAHLRKNHAKEFNPDEAFFDRKAYLTVSSQLHLEAMASGLDKVWTFSPVFRSENAQSTRHLAEFYMVEAEIAFATEINHILHPMEQLVKEIIHKIVYDSTYEFSIFSESNEELRAILGKILKHPFTVMTFKEASDLLASKGNSIVPPNHGLSREQELLLVEKLNDGVPVFVINWPSNIKPFYMRQIEEDPSLCSAVDLLVPGVGELCGGSLREHRAEVLQSRMKQLDPSGSLQSSLEWYLDLRRFGSVPTGGFGLGFDRLLQLITGVKNIKDVTAFPRWAHNCPM